MGQTIVPLHFQNYSHRFYHCASIRRTAMLFLLALWSPYAVAETVVENSAIKVALVDENGRETSVYQLPAVGDSVKDILFRTQVPDSLSYDLWTLEITNPATGQNYRLALEGKVPTVIHWDGNFSEGGTLRPNQTYYIRLLVFSSSRNATTSKVGVFTTQQGTGTEFVKMERQKLGFYAFPTGGLYYHWLKTSSTESSHFPTMQASLRLAFGDRHSFGFVIETSPNILTNVAVSPNGFFYSHVSVFYLARIWGALPHPPVLPSTPEYAKGRGRAAEVPALAYGAKSNLEVGLRVYNNVLRGFGGQTIDVFLSRQSTGLILTAMGDRRLGVFRIHGAVEAGYSVFRGSLFVLQTKAGISYDRFEHLSPAIEFKYQVMAGNAADDAFDGVDPGGPQGVTNQMIMGGLVFQFKI
jgi:hypothetical protein